MAKRTTPETEPAEDVSLVPAASRTPVVMWVDDALVCVEIIDAPRGVARDGVCRCEACHASMYADSAAQFL